MPATQTGKPTHPRVALLVENYPSALRETVRDLGLPFADAVLQLDDGAAADGDAAAVAAGADDAAGQRHVLESHACGGPRDVDASACCSGNRAGDVDAGNERALEAVYPERTTGRRRGVADGEVDERNVHPLTEGEGATNRTS